MMIMLIKHSKGHEPYTWSGVTANGIRTAVLVCQNGHRSMLGNNHSIGADGTVIPSVICTHEGCNFHENVRLMDWGRGVTEGEECGEGGEGEGAEVLKEGM